MTNVKRPINLQLKPTRQFTSNGGGGALSLGTPRAANNGSPNQQLFTSATAATTTTTSSRSIIAPNSLPTTIMPTSCHSPKALSPTTCDSLPSQVLPFLFVGNQEQTNRETLNRLNIKYILSLGLLPIVSTSAHQLGVNSSPTSANQRQRQSNCPAAGKQPTILMPVENSSIDFKIRIKSNTVPTPTSPRANTDSVVLGNPTVTATTPPGLSSGAIGQQAGARLRPNGVSSAANKSSLLRDENKGVKAARSVYCKCINVADNSDQLISKFFEEAYSFIDEARRKRCNILIHCLAGISRSPTFAIAYLMRVKSLHWRDAYELVKKSRPQIDPNLSFMGQLRIYNKTLKEEEAATRVGSEIPAKSSIK